MPTFDLGTIHQANASRYEEALIDTVSPEKFSTQRYTFILNLYDKYDPAPQTGSDKASNIGGDDDSLGIKFTVTDLSRVSLQISSDGYFRPDGTKFATNTLGRYPAIFAKDASYFLGGNTLDSGSRYNTWTVFQSTLFNGNIFVIKPGDYIFKELYGITYPETDYSKFDFYVQYTVTFNVTPAATYRFELPSGPLTNRPNEGTVDAGNGADGDNTITLKVVRLTGTNLATDFVLKIDPTSTTEPADRVREEIIRVQFAPGEVEKLVEIKWAADDLPELDEIIKLTTNLPAEAIQGSIPQITIANDDGLVTRDALIRWAFKHAAREVDYNSNLGGFFEKVWFNLQDVRNDQFPYTGTPEDLSAALLARDAEGYALGMYLSHKTGGSYYLPTGPLVAGLAAQKYDDVKFLALAWNNVTETLGLQGLRASLQTTKTPNTPPGVTDDAVEGGIDVLTGAWRRFLPSSSGPTSATQSAEQTSPTANEPESFLLVRSASTFSFSFVEGGYQIIASGGPTLAAPQTGAIVLDKLGGGVIAGGDGTDFVISTFSSTVVAGGAGDDIIFVAGALSTGLGGDGDDFVIGDAGAQYLRGGAGFDQYFGAAGSDTFAGTLDELNNDRIVDYEAGEQIVVEGASFDSTAVTVTQGSTIISIDVDGDGTPDSVITLDVDLADLLAAGLVLSVTQVAGGTAIAFINPGGTDQADTLYGDGGDDTLNGLGGDDKLFPGAGNDTVNGGEGNDRIFDPDGDNTLNGDAGNDILYAGGGTDTLNGGDGNDTLSGAGGDDVVNGGDGRDRLYGNAGNDTLDGGAENDNAQGGDGNDTIAGGDGNDFLYGQAGDDAIDGGTGNDQLFGEAGADDLDGGAGDDILRGGDGANRLAGGAGLDVLFGGADQDIFVLAKTFADRDWINGFVSGTDRLEVDGALFGLAPGALDASRLVANGNPVANAPGQFLFNTSNGTLRFDADGPGGAAAEIIARLVGTTSLAAGDFIVV
jgi:Ca2+-binding RTX toxin-like protein